MSQAPLSQEGSVDVVHPRSQGEGGEEGYFGSGGTQDLSFLDCDFSPSTQGNDLDYPGFTGSSQDGSSTLGVEMGMGMGMGVGGMGMEGAYAFTSQPSSQGASQSASEVMSLPSSLADGVGGLSIDTRTQSQDGIFFSNIF